jgi:excisionase family DNA binding protein
MTPKEASQFLGIGLTKTLQLIRAKRLKVWMLDNRIRVSVEACRDFLDSLPCGYVKGEPVYDGARPAKKAKKSKARKAVLS